MSSSGASRRAGARAHLPFSRLVSALDRAVDNVLENFGQGRLIFNLGHGIQPETPIAHVEQMLKRVRRAGG